MKQITKVRKAVCTIANELKKAGYSLSQAFRKAWRRVKLTMTIRAAGTTFMDAGIHVAASLMQIIGEYSYKESLGALINITI